MEIIPETQWPGHWFTLRDVSHAYLESLRDKSGHFTYLCVLDQSQLVTLDVLPGTKSSYYVPAGLRSCPVYSAPGKVLLSHENMDKVEEALEKATDEHSESYNWTSSNFPEHLKEVKDQGYGLDLEEHHRGLFCIAIPIFDKSNSCVASIGQSVLVQNPNYDSLRVSCLPAIREIKYLIEESLEHEWILPQQSEKSKILSSALNAMVHNLGKKDLDIGHLAEELHISQRQLTRMFKDHLEISPYQYLLNLRFKKACELLKHQDNSIKTIASSCGFSSSNNFCTAFKKRFDCSPDAYRHQQ
jgi:AraC-like DNA-binding protein